MATQAPRQAAVILAAWAAVAAGQDTTPCEAYNVDTGSGVCNGVPINVGSVICADGFDKSKCFASRNTDGRIVTYFFRGTPTGLPVAADIQSDCDVSDFPPHGGVAMAETFTTQNPPTTDGCYPAADVSGTNMFYTPGSTAQTIASITVQFAAHTDGTGVDRQGFIKIACVEGGPTSNFTYTTTGDDGHQSVYAIDTTADCTKSGGGDDPDPNLCESYNVKTGVGKCGGVDVNISAVICAGGFENTTCQASRSVPGQIGLIETFFFRGASTGLPVGPQIQRDCTKRDFPAKGGIALAHTYETKIGSNPPSLDGCSPAGIIAGTDLFFTSGASNGTLASLSLQTGVYIQPSGDASRGLVKINCQEGGPTNNFQYTTTGDEDQQSVYVIHTTAKCTM